MQILLTESEYNELKAQKRERIAASKEDLQHICTLAANHIPVPPRDWSQDKTPRPWGCILDEGTNPGYCDACPVDAICPNPGKAWSK